MLYSLLDNGRYLIRRNQIKRPRSLTNTQMSFVCIPIKMIYVNFFLRPHMWKTRKWCRFQLSYFYCGLVNRLTNIRRQFGTSRQPIALKFDSLCKTKDLLEIYYIALSVSLFFLFIMRCSTDLETSGLLVLIWTNDTDQIKTTKKFRPSFTTASRCEFDLVKLWAELLCSILIQPRYELQHQRHRQRRDGFSYLDVSWTCLFKEAAYCL